MRSLVLMIALLASGCSDSATGVVLYPPASAVIGPEGGRLALHRGRDTLVLLIIPSPQRPPGPVAVSIRQDPAHERAVGILPSTVVIIEPASTALHGTIVRFKYRMKEIPAGDSQFDLRVLRFRNGAWESGSSGTGWDTLAHIVEGYILEGGVYAVGTRP